MDRLLCEQSAGGAGDSSQSGLLSQRSDPVRLSVVETFERRQPGFSLMRSALIWNALDETGVPDVKGVWCHPAGGRFLTVVSIKQRYPGHARQAGMIASQCRSGAYLGRYVVVVDDDVDITNSEEFLWVLSSRSDPAVDRNSPARLERPARSAHPTRRSRSQLARGDRRHRPYEWREKFPKVSGASRELKTKSPPIGAAFSTRRSAGDSAR